MLDSTEWMERRGEEGRIVYLNHPCNDRYTLSKQPAYVWFTMLERVNHEGWYGGC